jgi:hypothetical protein
MTLSGQGPGEWLPGRLAGMPVTRNVAWDERLESFKGRDTARYVATAAATACAVCGAFCRPTNPCP